MELLFNLSQVALSIALTGWGFCLIAMLCESFLRDGQVPKAISEIVAKVGIVVTIIFFPIGLLLWVAWMIGYAFF